VPKTPEELLRLNVSLIVFKNAVVNPSARADKPANICEIGIFVPYANGTNEARTVYVFAAVLRIRSV